VLGFLSPEAEPVVNTLSLAPIEGALPISIDVAESAVAVLILSGAVALFFGARQIFTTGGVRTVVRLLAYTGLLLALIAIAQEATARGLMYWKWRPIDEGPRRSDHS
jgi:fructose-specific phosphotransferase system IIC component